ncbi:ImmA/IrrE family metallo-endopeptidase [Streptomyces sp. SAS_276]|uniref:ImmA/IrrE family metallo-endopeptidase n=1 Tax=Streptomyces sp. SAS_276 TaxID=3412745 RepID=UPI00403D362F
MNTDTQEFQPNWGVHPGEILGGILDQRGMKQVELAQRTGLSAKHVNQIIKQTIGISSDVSILLERALNVQASFWNDLDTQYQAFESRRRAEAALGEYATWASRFDTGTLRLHKIIDAADTTITRAEKILKLFQVATPDAFTQTWLRPSVSFRRSQAFTVSEPNTALWLRLVERSALDVSVQPFNARKLRTVAKSIPTMTTMNVPDGFIAARAALAEAGVALTFVREVPGTRVCAATWWINGDRPAIGITERHRRHDTFWFNLLHEIGHIVRHPRRTSFLDLEGGNASDQAEAEANDFAAQTLFPGDSSDSIAQATTHREIIIIAARLGVGVPMVAGRYGNLTKQWKLVGRLRPSISDEEINALETIAQDAAA